LCVYRLISQEERNLIENHFKYLGSSHFKGDNIEDWDCFKMDCEGHLVSMKHNSRSRIKLSNESIEHLSNFPHLRNLKFLFTTRINQSLTSLSLLSNLDDLSINVERDFQQPELSEDLPTELLKDLGLFSNLLSLYIYSYNGFENYKFDIFPSLLYIFVFF